MQCDHPRLSNQFDYIGKLHKSWDHQWRALAEYLLIIEYISRLFLQELWPLFRQAYKTPSQILLLRKPDVGKECISLVDYLSTTRFFEIVGKIVNFAYWQETVREGGKNHLPSSLSNVYCSLKVVRRRIGAKTPTIKKPQFIRLVQQILNRVALRRAKLEGDSIQGASILTSQWRSSSKRQRVQSERRRAWRWNNVKVMAFERMRTTAHYNSARVFKLWGRSCIVLEKRYSWFTWYSFTPFASDAVIASHVTRMACNALNSVESLLGKFRRIRSVRSFKRSLSLEVALELKFQTENGAVIIGNEKNSLFKYLLPSTNISGSERRNLNHLSTVILFLQADLASASNIRTPWKSAPKASKVLVRQDHHWVFSVLA